MVLLVALALRLAAGWVWQSRLDGHFGFGDSDSYWALARAIAAGEPYGVGEGRAFRTPGYPLLLAPIFLLAGDEPSVMWARAESALLGTLSVVAVWWLGRALFDVRAGLVAASIAAVYPGAIAIGALVLSEAAFCPLMLLNLILWTAAWHARSGRHAAVLAGSAGLVAGAATLVRPSWLLFVPFAIVVGLAAERQRARHLGVGAMVLAGLVAAMLPWWVRNARLTGRFVPTTLQVGASLYDGLNARATGASNMAWSDEATARFLRCERASSGVTDGASASLEYRLDRQLRAESLAWARAHPGRVARLAAIKFARVWNFWPNEAAFSAWPIRLAVFLTYVPVMVLAIMGAWATIHRGWPYVLCWLPAVYFTALHMVFVSSIRYRQPPMLALIVLAAGWVVARWGRSEEGSAWCCVES